MYSIMKYLIHLNFEIRQIIYIFSNIFSDNDMSIIVITYTYTYYIHMYTIYSVTIIDYFQYIMYVLCFRFVVIFLH